MSGDRMPVQWGVDHATRMVVLTADGSLRLGDFEACLEVMASAATLSYRKLVDLTGCSSIMSRDDLIALGARVNKVGHAVAMGPAAIVVASHDIYEQVRLFASLTAARRRLKIFQERGKAYEWLMFEAAEAPQHFPSENEGTARDVL